MIHPTKEAVYVAILEILTRLVAGDVNGVEQITHGKRLPAPELRAALSSIPTPLTLPPTDSLRRVASECVENWQNGSPSCALDIDLWTDGEPSDLTVEMTIWRGSGAPVIEIDNIHTL